LARTSQPGSFEARPGNFSPGAAVVGPSPPAPPAALGTAGAPRSGIQELAELEPGLCWLRHIKFGSASETGATALLGRYLVPQSVRGVNGEQGYQSGSYERRLREEGTFSLVFPNATGEDGVLHGSRLQIVNDPNYRMGNEWFEIWLGPGPGQPSELLFVGTPIAFKRSRARIELRGVDAYFLTKRARELANWSWHHAPRDVHEFWTQLWKLELYDEFESDSFAWSSSAADTPSGRFTVLRASQAAPTDSRARIYLDNTGGGSALSGFVLGKTGYPIGYQSSEAYSSWKVEGTVVSPDDGAWPFTHANTLLALGLEDGAGGSAIEIIATGLRAGAARVTWQLKVGGTTIDVNGPALSVPFTLRFAIEARERWAFCYVNGVLLGVVPLPANFSAARPGVRVYQTSAAVESGQGVWVELVGLRRTRPVLMRGADKGDYQLPRALTPGGLEGRYFDDSDGIAYDRVLNPTREHYASRTDVTLVGGAAPPAGGGTTWSVRWTGAIYLDLANFDYTLQTISTNGVRLWVGKTRFGEQLIDDWPAGSHGSSTLTTAALRSLLGSVSGWYPLVLEAKGYTPAFNYARSDAPSSYYAVGGTQAGAPALSPLGCVLDDVHFDSHFEKLSVLAQTFTHQFVCEPRSLESGEFPGALVPRVRVGRDTAKVLDTLEGVDPEVEVNAEDVVDDLLADAAGLADQEGSGQLSAELLDGVLAQLGLFLHQDHESLAEITFEALLQTRLESILAIRGTPWEQVAVRPRGQRQLLDSFPLTGALQKFHWLPGDGIRIQQPEIGVYDLAPRQITGLARDFVPQGLRGANVSFRDRPRGWLETLKRLQRQYFGGRRTFQGQLATVSGSLGGTTGAGAGTSTSRVALPPNLDDIIKATLVVTSKSDQSSWSVAVNGTARASVTAAGRIDLTQWLDRDGGAPSMRVVASGGTGDISYAIELQQVQR
jgi:hypothetical protein